MGNVVSQAFPGVYHRYCVCHIYKDGNKELQSCVWESGTKEEFESKSQRALAQQRHEEIIADHVDINEQPIMEKQMAAIYTPKIFYKFHKELWKCLACLLQLGREDDNLCFYKAFVLAYMNMKQTEYLSNKYILKRWTRAAKSDIVEEGGREMTSKSSKEDMTLRIISGDHS
ncbi:hypothetical protein L3X38_007270 [Prunus dulcis]|uniref:Protein FAR1-RELATED SEQUENCE n=1 Tax=Prunus dulcis TaxID=3755 RepID=A0AAD4ZUC1_PRUDU|nr:hypothetical protein L3X38_007270 [Prunus dulcis]